MWQLVDLKGNSCIRNGSAQHCEVFHSWRACKRVPHAVHYRKYGVNIISHYRKVGNSSLSGSYHHSHMQLTLSSRYMQTTEIGSTMLQTSPGALPVLGLKMRRHATWGRCGSVAAMWRCIACQLCIQLRHACVGSAAGALTCRD